MRGLADQAVLTQPAGGSAGLALLVGHGPGAVAPAGLAARLAATRRGTPCSLWLDGTMTMTLVAEPGARFADERAVKVWARRVWASLEPAADAPGPELDGAVAWKGGGADGTAGVTWLVPGADGATDDGLHQATAGRRGTAMAPLWAGVLDSWWRGAPAAGRARLLLAEGRALTLIDAECSPRGARLLRFERAGLSRADAALLAPWVDASAEAGTWVAGHGLAGLLPSGMQAVAALGEPSQSAPDLLARLPPAAGVQPGFVATPPLSAPVTTALVVTAALVLGLAGWSAFDARVARDATAARAAVQAEARAQRTAAGAADDKAQAEALARLAEPWGARFAAAEAAVPAGGGWLRFEQRPGQPLRLVGQGADAAEAYAVARQLARAPGIAEAVVLRSEALRVDRGNATAPAARFELAVRLHAVPGAAR